MTQKNLLAHRTLKSIREKSKCVDQYQISRKQSSVNILRDTLGDVIRDIVEGIAIISDSHDADDPYTHIPPSQI